MHVRSSSFEGGSSTASCLILEDGRIACCVDAASSEVPA